MGVSPSAKGDKGSALDPPVFKSRTNINRVCKCPRRQRRPFTGTGNSAHSTWKYPSHPAKPHVKPFCRFAVLPPPRARFPFSADLYGRQSRRLSLTLQSNVIVQACRSRLDGLALNRYLYIISRKFFCRSTKANFFSISF